MKQLAAASLCLATLALTGRAQDCQSSIRYRDEGRLTPLEDFVVRDM